MDVRDFAKNNILVLDGAMGTMLQGELRAGEAPEALNSKNPQAVKAVHTAYLQAGANMILSNTFGTNRHEEIERGVVIAKEVATEFGAYTALDIGPIGELLEPLGTLSFDQAYQLFKEKVCAGVRAGADAIYIETMTDLYEARCAVLAAKENCGLPIFCTMSFEQNMRTFMGVDISSMALTLSGLGADFIGINCSVGPKEMYGMAKELVKWTKLPIVIKPNAGLPVIIDGRTMFRADPAEFACEMQRVLDLGITVIGGCCGTDPCFIEKLSAIGKGRGVVSRKMVEISAVCSPTKTVVIDRVRIVGERINPTGKPRFQTAIRENDMDFIISQALEQTNAGADILDVNVGLPGIDEANMMARVVKGIQSVTTVPLQIDSSSVDALDAGLRAYNGKAIINSVNGEDEVLDRILPLAKKYGAAIIGLTMNKGGIPKTAESRLKIAQKIVTAALTAGISKSDIFIDCLTLTSGAEQEYAYETLKAVALVKQQLGVNTVLGVSNISFGLPARETINQVFLSLALANGLDLPIINPNVKSMVDTIFCFHQLKNVDVGSHEYINRFGKEKQQPMEEVHKSDIAYCIENGIKEGVKEAIDNLLKGNDGFSVVDTVLIPILDSVGRKYECGEIFLPQLLQSAEAAKAAFEIIKTKLPRQKGTDDKVILATVEGDIHDIGKNIVKVVLENYGYNVIDLGRDVKIGTVADEAIKNQVKLVGLSALMTTTVANMAKTIADIKSRDCSIRVMVGGAVLNQEYASKINADFYAKDAMAAVAIAREIFGRKAR